MSEISRELQEQQAKEIGPIMKKLFGNIPVIDAEEERKRFETQQRAEAILAHVRELGDDY